MPTFLLFLLFAIPASLLAAPPKACTQMACLEGFNIDFERPLQASGNYVFNIEADGKQIICSGHLPFDDCGGEKPNFSCNAEGVFIGESGCALPKEEHALIGLSMQRIPEHITLAVSHAESGKRFTHDQYVKKNCFFPNGEGCDPKPCCQANYRLLIDVR